MPRSLLLCLLSLLLACSSAAAQDGSTRAVKVDARGRLVNASAAELARPEVFRQVIIVPAGYTAAERIVFQNDAEKMVRGMGNLPETVYTRMYRDRLVYIIHWMPGGSLASGQANFGAKTYPQPFRGGTGISMRNDKLVRAIDAFSAASRPALDPIGVIVLYNLNEHVTANAVPPILLNDKYGIARLTRYDINDRQPFAGLTWGQYVPAHELAHAALGFMDEYVEPMLADFDIHELDVFTPLLLAGGSPDGWNAAWQTLIGNYDLRISETLADNGSGHLASRRRPTLVHTPGVAPVQYDQPGGMMFGRGTMHDTGDDIMNSSFLRKRPGNRFGWGHTPAQMRVIKRVFDPAHADRRPNDEIRPAGPMRGPQWGDRVRLILFDGDKNSRWQPTTRYEVEIRWKEDGVWWTQTRTVAPRPVRVDLKTSLAADALSVLRNVAVAAGMRTLNGDNGQDVDLSHMTVEQMMDDLLAGTSIPLPYQAVDVPAPTSFATYYWRFRTYNGSMWSGWTAWASFYRAM